MQKISIKNVADIAKLSYISITCPIIIDDIITDYYVTNHGQVYKVLKTGKHRLLKETVDNHGYHRVVIFFKDSNNTIHRASLGVHRIVAMAFIYNPKPKLYREVNHINGKRKDDNSVANLEWCDHSYNMKHSYETGLRKKGSEQKLSIYSDEQIHTVCRLLQENERTLTNISMYTGVALYTISDIIKHKKWRHISDLYDIDEYNVRAINTGSKPKYTDEMIHEVCKLLEEGKMKLNEISISTGVGFNTIADIKRHKIWKKISDMYNF